MRKARFAALLVDLLARIPLRRPTLAEREPLFVSRVVAPPVTRWLKELDIAGLHLGGEGVGPVRPVSFLGREFRPDLTVMDGNAKLFALEAKYARAATLPSDVSKAIGQATLYKACGFPYVAILLLDLDRCVGTESIKEGRTLIESLRLLLVVRQRLLTGLTEDKAPVLRLRSNEEFGGRSAICEFATDESGHIDAANQETI